MLKLKKIITLILLCSTFNISAEEALPPKKLNWPFAGALGQFDRQAAQRGFQVYKEVCANCHAVSLLSYRNLKDIGFMEDEVKQIAAEHTVKDFNEQGEIIDRPAKMSDKIISPFPNEAASRAANNGAYPVDLTLITKARHDGPNYVYSVLTGYTEPPKDFHLMNGLNYNLFFPGRQIAMPAPLSNGLVQYHDGTAATVEQMARDVVIFLQWAAEPEMEHRKSLGLKILMYLLVFTSLFYVAKQRIWSRLK